MSRGDPQASLHDRLETDLPGYASLSPCFCPVKGGRPEQPKSEESFRLCAFPLPLVARQSRTRRGAGCREFCSSLGYQRLLKAFFRFRLAESFPSCFASSFSSLAVSEARSCASSPAMNPLTTRMPRLGTCRSLHDKRPLSPCPTCARVRPPRAAGSKKLP